MCSIVKLILKWAGEASRCVWTCFEDVRPLALPTATVSSSRRYTLWCSRLATGTCQGHHAKSNKRSHCVTSNNETKSAGVPTGGMQRPQGFVPSSSFAHKNSPPEPEHWPKTESKPFEIEAQATERTPWADPSKSCQGGATVCLDLSRTSGERTRWQN